MRWGQEVKMRKESGVMGQGNCKREDSEMGRHDYGEMLIVRLVQDDGEMGRRMMKGEGKL